MDVATATDGQTTAACWSCKGPVATGLLFCPTCGAIQPPGQADRFTRFGQPAGFDIDEAALETVYFDLQRKLHPDRFATASPKERALSQSQAIAVNEAYETLRDPLRRAAYLLTLKGRTADVDRDATINDPELLMESMEAREALAEAATPEEAQAIARDTAAKMDDCKSALSRAFSAGDLDEAGNLTTRLKYLAKLAGEARARRMKLAGRG
ncbi:MAG: Fe-S protein assembly co-chaperone HscB [Rhodospirillales bacterium]